MSPRPFLATFAFLASLSAAACGGRTDSSSADAGPDVAPATPASGGGVCCPISSDPCGACDDGAGGGWAPDLAACTPNPNAACDGMLGIGKDSHGCSVILAGDSVPGATCCGCAPGGSSGSNPTCILSGNVWQCPDGDVLACATSPTQGAACVANTGSCFTCVQGAGIVCSCPGLADAGAVWECVGAGVACSQ